MKILASYSIKGGVGKTATSVNLAHLAATHGYRTLLFDLDPQGASSFYFRVRPSEKCKTKFFFSKERKLQKNIKASDFPYLDILPAKLSFRNFDIMLNYMKKSTTRLHKTLLTLKKEYDLILIDCPPSISLLSENVFNAADKILIPLIPTTLSERTLQQLTTFFSTHGYRNKKLIPFFSMVQSQKKLHKDAMTRLRKQYPRLLEASIPFSADIEKMGVHREPVTAFAKETTGAQAFMALWEEVESKLACSKEKRALNV
ncbi:ParA family protein [Zooshikella sp. RANM57]|uniref:ParA family protein n=1 Tax=Zooshikella sp. RANM57 TaxID=3425863 RepID=UPI003D6F8C6A